MGGCYSETVMKTSWPKAEWGMNIGTSNEMRNAPRVVGGV
jgi:hypothetical protein